MNFNDCGMVLNACLVYIRRTAGCRRSPILDVILSVFGFFKLRSKQRKNGTYIKNKLAQQSITDVPLDDLCANTL